MIEYKGYIGAVNFDPEIDLFHGTIINTTDVITFYGASVTELRVEMQKSVEGYVEFCREQGKIPEKPFSKGIFYMPDLKNTIAHILEHQQHLVKANEATTQQYVVLPILRALGWDDTNLAVMEVIPEHNVETGNVDYALKVDQKPVLFLECKKWDRPLAEKQASQIFRYAFEGGAPIVGLTNGKIWRFYFSWVEGTSMDERVFSDIDIANLERAVSSLEEYLLKSNVASGKAERNARIALEAREKADTPKPRPIDSKIEDVSNVIDSQPATKQSVAPSQFSDEWTVERIGNLVSEEIRDYYEANFPEERCKVFYRTVAETQNLIEAEGWQLEPRFREKSCRFWLTDKGVTQVKSVFGIHLQYNPFTLHVRIMKKDAEELKRQCGCEFYSVSKNKYADYIYYNIPDDITELRPVLEFAYNKHSGS